jgi:hypothetical protein
MATAESVSAVLFQMQVSQHIREQILANFETYAKATNYDEFWRYTSRILGPRLNNCFIATLRNSHSLRNAQSSRVAPAQIVQSSVPVPLSQGGKLRDLFESEKVDLKKLFLNGYDADLFECKLCMQCFETPIFLSHPKSCGNTVCQKCFASILEKKPSCPFCRVSLKMEHGVVNRDLNECMMSSKCICPRGCEKCFLLKDAETHLRVECRNALVVCSYKSCGFKLKRADLENHEKNECIYRPVPCNCGMTIPLVEIESHRDESCDSTKKPCKFERFGCTFKINPMHLDHHNTYCSFSLVEKTLLQQEEEIKKLKEALARKKTDDRNTKKRRMSASCDSEKISGIPKAE